MTRNSGRRFSASRAPAGTFQHASICCLTRSISLVESWAASGASGCELFCAGPCDCCSCGVILRLARFFRSWSKEGSSCFFACEGTGGFGAGGGGGGGGGLGGCGFSTGGGGGGGGGAGGAG